jgi:competence protein ComEC
VLFREIPFLRLFVPLCAGVIVADAVPRLEVFAIAAGAASLTVMSLRVGIKRFLPDSLFGLALALFLASSGYLLYVITMKRAGDLEEKRQTMAVRLSEFPRKRTGSYSFRARIISVAGSNSQSSPGGSMLLYFMSDTLPSDWQPGDIMKLNITPRHIENNGNPCEFNYRRYLEGQGIRYMGFFRARDIVIRIPASHLSLMERSSRISHKMISLFAGAGLHDEALGLVTALTMGDRELLDKDQLNAFSRAGAMHVMAVSGLHVGMISLALTWMLFFMCGKLRRFKATIIIPLLWCFAFITGMSPSVMRATIMFTFLQAGSLMKRPAPAMNNLLASAFILTVARPPVLFEAGFQLSYLAVTFILLFYHRLFMLFRPANRVIRYLWQVIALSLVAQAGTMPLTVKLFNIFPLFFLLTNIVIIPVTFLVLLSAMLLLLFAPVPTISSLLAILLDWLSRFALGFTGAISSFDHAVVGNVGMTTTETVTLITAIALLLAALLRIRKITLRPFLLTALLLLGFNIAKTAGEASTDGPVIYNLKNIEYRAWQHGRMLLLKPRDGTIPAEVKKHAATRGLKIKIIESG